MTRFRGRIVNTTLTIVPFQKEFSKTFEECSIIPRLVLLPLKYLCRVLIRLPDMMTTDSSSSPFAQDELVAIIDIVNSLKGIVSLTLLLHF